MALRSSTPSAIGRWNALRPLIRPMPPARLLTTAVRTASARSLAPVEAPPLLMRPIRPHVAVSHLPAAEIDRVVGGQLVVDEIVGLAVAGQGPVATVGLRELLLDDVGLDGHAEVVGLGGQVGRRVVINAVHLEAGVTEVAPEDREHPKLVGPGEGLADLLDLAGGLRRAEVDSGPHPGRPKVEGLFDRTEHDLGQTGSGRVNSSLWLILTMNGIRWAYRRDTEARTP